MDHSAKHDDHSQGMNQASLIATLLIMFVPSALTLLWVLHLASAAR
jgi:hypothetical protein